MQSNRVLLSILGWVIGFIIFFPILWMVMASLKTEIEAVATPPSFFFVPTLENYFVVQSRSDYLNYAWNSIVISVFATLLAILIAVPASYSFAFRPTKRTQFKLVWILSTKMMPPVGVLIPMYLFYKNMGAAGHSSGFDPDLHADQPANCHLGALYLFQGYSTGNFGSSPDGM